MTLVSNFTVKYTLSQFYSRLQVHVMRTPCSFNDRGSSNLTQLLLIFNTILAYGDYNNDYISLPIIAMTVGS